MYRIIKKIEYHLIENALLIQLTLVAGKYRYLRLILSLIKYNTVTGHDFERYMNLDILPIFLPNTTQYQIL